MLWGWACLVVLYFSWEMVAYRGLFALAAEWQFHHLGQDLPTFTFGVLATIFSAPALYLFRQRTRRRHYRAEDQLTVQAGGEAVLELYDAQRATAASRDYKHFLYGITTALGIATLATLLWTLTLPTREGPVRDIVAGRALPADGPARLAGTIGYGRIASYSRGLLFLRRSELYAPVSPPEGREGLVRVFIEFTRAERADIQSGGTLANRTGILVRRDLPGALIRLYAYLGYRVAPHYEVLYASAFTLRWPYYLAAIQFGLGTLGFLLVALLQKRHIRRLDRIVEDFIRPARVNKR
ncbi:hypothetical protein [Sphingomonas nostoxanthinifaciens]|uniref:hypothetical protein n=1 Tax=Sphingomonas nostoxanthinifaciens TaxID=2872652 RepID=UPI001CC1ED48|nr:hypothetical protein [Sphingomonas nostoxanthinifaciens]UAK25424.1 hypothetical protein K8P63_04385 [Sphingomonas nostoxanthinifaciens]